MDLSIPGPAYRIHTQRLVIRCWEPSDALRFKEAVDANIDHLRPWMPWAKDEPQELQKKIELLRMFRGSFDLGRDFIFGIFNRFEAFVIGGTGLHPRVGPLAREIGYWIDKDHTNQGFATEVAGALTRVAFEIEQVRRVEIHVDPANVRSWAVPRKLGYIHEATLRKRMENTQGELRDEMVWSMLLDDFEDSPAAKIPYEAFDAMGRKILRIQTPGETILDESRY